MSQQTVAQAQNGHSIFSRKKIRHFGTKIDWGGKYYIQCIRANRKVVNFKYTIVWIFHIYWDFWKSPATWPLAAAAAAIAAEPQPQAFDPVWYPYRKIRESKRKTSLFFSTTSFLLILYVSSRIFRFRGSNPRPLYVSANGIPGPKWSLYLLPKNNLSSWNQDWLRRKILFTMY